MNQEWKIGNITIPNRVVVAPMAGVTNSAFRIICKKMGAGLVVCEMVSDRALIHRNDKTMHMLGVNEEEHPMSIQVFGGTKETLVQAAQFIDQNTDADIIDINMGCPVNKIVKTDAGARWLLDPNKVYEMLSAVTKAVKKPVTAKMRIGWDRDHVYAVENALAAQEAGVSALAMHGRTRKQMYQGEADWSVLKEVADHLSIPFIGNGDVRTPQQAKTMIEDVGADAVMIARAVEGNPWMLKQTSHYLETGELLPEPSLEEKIQIAEEHLHNLVELKGERVGPREFRGQAGYYLKGISHAARTRAALTAANTEEEMDQIFAKFLDKQSKRLARS